MGGHTVGQLPGKFISLEGGEGTGKTTQIAGLKSRLEAQGISVVLTREPGGSRGAEEIRKLLVEGEPGRWSPMSEVLLHYAARLDHVEKVIKPALEESNWVLTDRFSDSTFAYQGYAQGLGCEVIGEIHRRVLGDFHTDLTLILDLDVEVGLARSGIRLEDSGSGENRYERMGRDFHESLRNGFLEIAKAIPERCSLINASGSADAVETQIWDELTKRFGELDE